MTKRIQPQGLTRRALLSGAAAVGAAGLILPASYRSASAEPKRGGTFRIGFGHGNTSDTLNPALWDQAFVQVLGNTMHNYLTVIGADAQLQPELAESWEASADAATWTFRLRQGVTFHNGKSLVADDVVASLNHHRGPNAASAAGPLVAPIVDIRADGDSTVVVTLEAGNADFPFLMSDYHLPILPAEEDGTIDYTKGVGCGGYVLESFEPGVDAHFTRNPNYWKEGHAHFDRVELYAILDSAARQNALITGEVDVIDRPDLNTISLLQRAGANIISVSGTQHYTFVMDSRVGPYSDNNVRLALKYGLNRQQMVDTVLSGFGSVGNDHPIGRSNRFHASELEQREFDPDRARFHLRQAGLDSLTVDLSAADAAFSGAVDAAVLFSETAAQAGITLNPIREPSDGYWSNVWMVKPFSAVYWGGRPTEDWMFATAYASGAAWNDGYWEHERFNELLRSARSELNEDLRREQYVEMQQIVRDEGSTIIPMFSNYVMATSSQVRTPEQIGANTTLDGVRATERWWFA